MTSSSTLLRFFLPTLAIWLIGPSLSMIDTAVVGSKSASQLAALGPGCILCDCNGYLFSFLAVATTNLMAIAIANRNQNQAVDILSDAVGIALVLGVLFGVGTYLACPSILRAMTGSSSDVLGPAISYVQIRSWGAPSAFVMFVTNAFFLAAWDPQTPLRSAIAAGIINLVLDLFLVNVMGWGITGAAVATVVAQVAVSVLLIWSVYKPLPSWSPISHWKLHIKWRLPTLRAAVRFLTFAGPICFVLLTKVLIYNRLSSYSSSLGATQSGANHIAMIIFGWFAVFGDVVSQAAQAFMPASVGFPERAKTLAKRLFGAGAGIGLINSCIAGAVCFFPWVFTNNPAVIALARHLAPLLGLALLVHTASMATEGMLMAGRDLNFLITSYFGNMGLVMASLFMVQRAEMGVFGSFLCLCQFQITRLVLNAIRLTRSKNSPLRSTETLKSWITEDVKVAAA